MAEIISIIDHFRNLKGLRKLPAAVSLPSSKIIFVNVHEDVSDSNDFLIFLSIGFFKIFEMFYILSKFFTVAR